jgi:hypothetical protein
MFIRWFGRFDFGDVPIVRRKNRLPGVGLVAATAVWVVVAGSAAIAHTPAQDEVSVPSNATALEGTPHVRIDTNEGQVKRRELTKTETTQNRLAITVDHGRYFWSSRDNALLTLSSSGEFTYLLSSKPGNYIRFRRVNDRITYVEHLDSAQGNVTYWGELRVVLGN